MTRMLVICISIFLVFGQEAMGMVDPGKVFTDPRVVQLAQSVAKGDVPAVQHEIAAGADVKAKGLKGMTVTHFALYADSNAPQVLHLLLKAGADPISRLESGADVPHYAAERDDANPEFLAVLLDAGVSPSLVGGSQNNSLLNAGVSGRNEAVVNLLLSRGANVNYNHPFTGTALHTAITIGDYRMATLLLDHGADPHLRDRQDPSIAPNIPRMTPAEVYCRHQSGKRRNPTPQQMAEFEAMKTAFAHRGVILPCGL